MCPERFVTHESERAHRPVVQLLHPCLEALWIPFETAAFDGPTFVTFPSQGRAYSHRTGLGQMRH